MSLDDRMREWLRWRMSGCVGPVNVPMAGGPSRRAFGPGAVSVAVNEWQALLPPMAPVIAPSASAAAAASAAPPAAVSTGTVLCTPAQSVSCLSHALSACLLSAARPPRCACCRAPLQCDQPWLLVSLHLPVRTFPLLLLSSATRRVDNLSGRRLPPCWLQPAPVDPWEHRTTRAMQAAPPCFPARLRSALLVQQHNHVSVCALVCLSRLAWRGMLSWGCVGDGNW